MPSLARTYFSVVQVSAGWAIRGGAFDGRSVYEYREDAIKEAGRMALGLHSVADRPTGVRVQYGLSSWADVELFGEEQESAHYPSERAC